MVPGSLGEQEQRTPGSVPPQAVNAGEVVHFVHQSKSQAHGGFVVATADVAFAEFGVVVAAAVSFVAAAHALFVAAAVAVAGHAVDAEGVVAAAAEFAAGLCDVAAAAAVVFALASAAAVTGVGVLPVLSRWVGSVTLSCCLEMSGSRLAGAAWADQRPTEKAATPSFLQGVMYCAAGGSGHLVSRSLEKPGIAAAAAAPNPTHDP